MIEYSKSFQQGQSSWNDYFICGFKNLDSYKNPYQVNSVNWMEWNRGWNTNFKGIL